MAQQNISINNSTASDDDLLNRELIEFISKHEYVFIVFLCVLSFVEIPVMILTLIGLCFIIKSRPAASVFVSNLILSDLIQVICILIKTARRIAIFWSYDLHVGYLYSLIAGLYFMACVASERYLLVSHPIWYRSHHSLKLSCFISVIVWFVPLIFVLLSYYCLSIIPLSIAFLIPYIIIVLCFAGTCRGLSRSISLTALKRKLILGSLFLVLLTYTFLILPAVIMLLIVEFNYYSIIVVKFYPFTQLLLYVNPLADCFLYLFMRPDVRNMMKSVRCCCRRQRSNHNQDEHSVVNPQSSCCTAVCCISDQEPASHSLNTCSSV